MAAAVVEAYTQLARGLGHSWSDLNRFRGA